MKKLLSILGVIFLALIILGIIGNIIDRKSAKKDTLTDSTIATISDSKKDSAPESNWVFDSTINKMTSKINYTASISANELLDLKFPYQGGVSVSLSIRKKAGEENEAFLYLSKGQLMAAHSYEEGTIRLRFDEEAPESYSVIGSTDNSSNIVFINSVNKVINKLKRSKKLIIEAVVYDNGNQQMEFNTTGFKWKH